MICPSVNHTSLTQVSVKDFVNNIKGKLAKALLANDPERIPSNQNT
jgi:hypothetical protein